MVDQELVLIEDSEGVRTLTLNRPGQLNAFNQSLCSALAEALGAAQVDENVRVVVLTGAGRSFSAGTDLYELAQTGDFRGSPGDPHTFERLIDRLAEFPKPLICAVNGVAVGLGVTMLGHADLVFMAETAHLKCPFTSLGLAPEAAASVTFPLLLGRQDASWMLMSSEWIDAADARAMGLAWRVVPDEAVLTEALDHAHRLAIHPLASLVASKRVISATFAQAVSDGRDRENESFDVLLRTPESRAAVAAFAIRRNERLGARNLSYQPHPSPTAIYTYPMNEEN
jgi:enoyl-CoA hydratase/carnithine racemase